jgi:hypothetical protein
MAGKFSLLTTLTLNAANFNSGIDKAKQTTKEFATGVETAGKSVKQSFAGLTSVAGGLGSTLNTSLGGLPTMLSGALGGFKSMIPAITGIKTALLSTGIGAIVVALGIAFSSLTSYLSGTSEGANKVKVMFSYISGAATALMNRIKYLGSALFSLLTGDIEGFKKSISEAFKGGFYDEVVATAKESADITREQIALDKQKRVLAYEDADNMVKVAKLKEVAKNRDIETNETLKERLSAASELRDIENDTNTKKISIAKAQYDLDIKINSQKAYLSKEDKDRVQESYIAWKTAETKKFDDLIAANAIVSKIRIQQKKDDRAEFQDQKEQLKIISDLKEESTKLEIESSKDSATTKRQLKLVEIEKWKQEEIDKVNSIKATTDVQIAEQKRLISEINKQASIKTKKVNNEENLNDQQKLIDGQKSELENKSKLNDTYFKLNLITAKNHLNKKKEINDEEKKNEISDLKNSLDQQLITREEFEKKRKDIIEKYRLEDIANSQEQTKSEKEIQRNNQEATLNGLSELGDASQSFFGEQSSAYKAFALSQALISTYLAAASIMANTAKLGPIAMGISMAGTIAMGLANVAKIAGFADGGIVGGHSFYGDKVSARLNSGEMVLNRTQQSNLFSIANGSNNIINGGEVSFRIEGNALVGVLNNHNKRLNNFR